MPSTSSRESHILSLCLLSRSISRRDPNAHAKLYFNPSFSSDTPAELELVRSESLAAGADAAVVSNHWAEGGKGAIALAEATVAVCEGESEFKFLYDVNATLQEKMESVAKEIYRADGVEYSELAQKQIETYTKQGYGNLPSECWLFERPSFGETIWLTMQSTQQSALLRHNTRSRMMES